MKKTLLTLLLAILVTYASAENVTLTTYFPAPSGAYKAMRSHGMCVGANCTHALISDNNLSVQGRIGIGTTAPGYALQIGSGTASHVGPADAFINGDLEVSGNFWGSGANLTNLAQGGLGEVQYNDGTGNLAGAANFIFNQGTGNVGIGVPAPGVRLAVNGAISPQGNLDLPAATSGAVYLTGGYISPDAGRVVFGDTTGWKLHFSTRTGSLTTDRMTIVDNGNVGIGSTTPATRLDVNGNMFIASRLGVGTRTPQGALDISSTTGALVLPRMTTAQRNALGAVPAGSLIFNTNTGEVEIYTGGAWANIAPASGGLEDTYGARNDPPGGARDAEACRDHFNDDDTCDGTAWSRYTCEPTDTRTCVDYYQANNMNRCFRRTINCNTP